MPSRRQNSDRRCPDDHVGCGQGVGGFRDGAVGRGGRHGDRGSRATAQRYLSALADAGKVELIPRYGVLGRPEHRYRWVG